MPTPTDAIGFHLLDMASAIDRHGLWTGGPNFVDPASGRIDIPAAAFQAATGTLPFIFAIPTSEAADVARDLIEATPAAMDVLNAIAGHLNRTWPYVDWTDDPIDRLSFWGDLVPDIPDAVIPQTLRDLAHELTAAPAFA